jgi:hypothetical protein
MADPNIIILGHLRGGAISVFLALGLAMLGFFLWEELWGDAFADTLYYHLLGRMTGPVAIGIAIVAVYLFVRMWRERCHYLHHDGVTLFKGSDGSWPLASIRDAMVTRNWLGIRSLRIDVGQGVGATPELAKTYMLREPPEAVRDAVMVAVARARGGVPLPASVH